MTSDHAISLVESLQVLADLRTDEVVVTTMGAAREWVKICNHPLDFVMVPSSMGQASSVGLGIALARPDKQVIVCNGDGSMLMNLGSLITISTQAPKNFALLIFDNGMYEVTGGQATPASTGLRGEKCSVQFDELASVCGFGTVQVFKTLDEWQSGAKEFLAQPGPICGVLKTAPVSGNVSPKSPGPAKQRALNFKEALAADS